MCTLKINVFVQLMISWQDNYLFFIINYYMKTSLHVSLTGPHGERGWGMLPHPRPRLPVGGEIFPVYIPVGEEISPSPSPHRGIPRGESGIGSPLPSLFSPPLASNTKRVTQTYIPGEGGEGTLVTVEAEEQTRAKYLSPSRI
jgi:hypothetical protein